MTSFSRMIRVSSLASNQKCNLLKPLQCLVWNEERKQHIVCFPCSKAIWMVYRFWMNDRDHQRMPEVLYFFMWSLFMICSDCCCMILYIRPPGLCDLYCSSGKLHLQIILHERLVQTGQPYPPEEKLFNVNQTIHRCISCVLFVLLPWFKGLRLYHWGDLWADMYLFEWNQTK